MALHMFWVTENYVKLLISLKVLHLLNLLGRLKVICDVLMACLKLVKKFMTLGVFRGIKLAVITCTELTNSHYLSLVMFFVLDVIFKQHGKHFKVSQLNYILLSLLNVQIASGWLIIHYGTSQKVSRFKPRC